MSDLAFLELVAIEFDRIEPEFAQGSAIRLRRDPAMEVKAILEDGSVMIHEVTPSFGFDISASTLACLRGYRLEDEIALPLTPTLTVRVVARFARELAAAAEITGTRIIAGETHVRQRVDRDDDGHVRRTGAASKESD